VGTNAFGTFLDTKDLLASRKRVAASGVDDALVTHRQARPATDLSSERLIDLVSNVEFPLPVDRLYEESGLKLSDFAPLLDRLLALDIVALRQDDDAEIAELTEFGSKLRMI
jgi:hypothetical protein